MEEKRPRGMTILAWSFPFLFLLLVPEIANSVFWSCWFIVESINHSNFGSTMETRVGLGLIFTVVVYGFFFVVGATALGFIIWRIKKEIKTARGLWSLSDKSRNAATKASICYSVFLVGALFLCNYCNLPGRADVEHFNDGRVARTSCTESNKRRGIQVLDLLVLPYYVSVIFYLTRPKVKEQFQ